MTSKILKPHKAGKVTRKMAKDAVKKFTREKVVEYPVEDEIYNRLRNIILEYDGEVSLSSVLGVLRIIEHDLISYQD